MRITKLEHSSFIIEIGGERLIVDPGSFTTPITDASGVTAVVFTHEHPDHFIPEQLQRILDQRPDALALGTAGVAAAAESTVRVVAPGETVEHGGFTLEFSGGEHAVIHSSVPAVDNLGLTVNGRFYTAGDAFTVPEHPVEILAVPAGAPWLKISEVIEFVLAAKPKHTFPVHEMVLSVAGKELAYSRIQWATEQVGGTFHALDPFETLDV